jgi:hypothetical protein
LLLIEVSLCGEFPFGTSAFEKTPGGLDLEGTAGDEILCARGLKGHLPAAEHAGGLPPDITRVLQFAPKSGMDRQGETKRNKW